MTRICRRAAVLVVAFLTTLGLTVVAPAPAQSINWGPFGASLYVSGNGATSYWDEFPPASGLKTYLGYPVASRSMMRWYDRFVLGRGMRRVSSPVVDVDAVWLQPGPHRMRYRTKHYVGENPSGYGEWWYGPWGPWFTVNGGKYGAAWKLKQMRLYEYHTNDKVS